MIVGSRVCNGRVFTRVCCVISNGAPVGFCHAPVEGWRHLSPTNLRKVSPEADGATVRVTTDALDPRPLRPLFINYSL